MIPEDAFAINAHAQAIIKQYESLILEADRLFHDYVQTNSFKIKCNVGCTDCCIHDFSISFIEAYYLEMAFQALPPETRHGIRLNALDCVRKMVKLEKMASAIEGRSPEIAEFMQNVRGNLGYVLRRTIKCPFVDKHSRCLVYKYRSVICRLFGVPIDFKDGGKPYRCEINTPVWNGV